MFLSTMVTAALLFGGGSDTSIPWVTTSIADAAAQAQQQNKPLMAFFWWDGSDFATKMREETLTHPEVVKALSDFVCFNGDHKQPGVAALFDHYKIQVAPTCFFFNPNGGSEDWIGGFVDRHEFVRDLERIKEYGPGTVTHIKNKINEAKSGSNEDLDLRMTLAGKLEDMGDQEGHDNMLISIRDLDPKGETLAGCRGHLLVLNREITKRDGDGKDGAEGSCDDSGSCGDGKSDGDGATCDEGKSEGATCDEGKGASCGEGEGASCGDSDSCEDKEREMEWRKNWDLKPLYKFAKVAKNKTGRFEAWDAIGGYESRRGELTAAIKAYQTAAKTHPTDGNWFDPVQWYVRASSNLRQAEAKPTGASKKVAVQFAQQAVDLVEQNKNNAISDWGEDQYRSFHAQTLAALGQAQAYAGKAKKARKSLERCVELDPTDQHRALLASIK